MEEAFEIITPLALFIIGIAIFALFIYKFYLFVGSRDIFAKKGRYADWKEGLGVKTSKIRRAFKVLEHIVIFPFVLLFWFIVFFLMILFLSKGYTVDMIMMMSMAILGAIRITSYFTEEMSMEMAKLLPLVILGMIVFDVSYFSFSASIDKLVAAVENPMIWKQFAYYFFFVTLLELFMHAVYALIKFIRKDRSS